MARDLGADYVLTLDPDERLVFSEHWRAVIETNPTAEVFISRDKDDGYYKERVLKCKSDLAWEGPACEYMTGMTMPQVRIGIAFWELPKTPEQERRRWERGVRSMTAMIEKGDDRYRWRRHRGSCLMGLGRTEEAIADYRAALPLANTPEETAWMRYLLCEQSVLAEKFDEATEDAADALAAHAGFIPEFGWVLAYCELKRNNLQNASRWAQIASQLPEDRTRVGFRGKQAREGCRNILGYLHSVERRDGSFTAADFDRRKAMGPNYRRVAAALVGLFAPEKHVDLGAGQGLLVEAMRDAGVDCAGIELAKAAEQATREDIRQHIVFGVGSDGWNLAPPCELVSSVEVLEHIPEEQADQAVAAICGRSTRWVYFSAAAPGQPGKGHVNCQAKPYWRAKFEANGFRFAEAETAAFVAKIHDLQPCWWLPKNAMIFCKEGTQ